MEIRDVKWFSPALQKEMHLKIYGSGEVPVLAFPTGEAMCDNFENFGMIETLAPDIDSGHIQVFTVDSVDSETWTNIWGDKEWRAERQEAARIAQESVSIDVEEMACRTARSLL